MSDIELVMGALDASGTSVSSRYGNGPNARPSGKKGCPSCDFMGFMPNGPCNNCPDYEIEVQEKKLEAMKCERKNK